MTLIPVDYNPFEKPAAASGLTPVSGNPFDPSAKPSADDPSSLKEWGKALGRGALDTGALINRAALGASNLAGRGVGVAPAVNPVSKFLDQGDEEYGAMTKGFAPSQEGDVTAGRIAPADVPLAKNEQWAKDHYVQNFVSDQVEGAIPYVAAAPILAAGGAGALPVVAGLSTHARLTKKLTNEGMDSDEAMGRAAVPAATEAALFGAMHYAKNAVMGSKNAVTGQWNRGALDLLEPKSIAADIGREAAFTGAYLHGQGEAVQAAELAAGATSPEEYQKNHGYDPKKGALDNLGSVALAQAKSLGTSALVGAGFGVHGAVRNKLERVDAARRAGAKEAIEEAAPVVTAGESDLTGEAVTLDQHIAEQKAAAVPAGVPDPILGDVMAAKAEVVKQLATMPENHPDRPAREIQLEQYQRILNGEAGYSDFQPPSSGSIPVPREVGSNDHSNYSNIQEIPGDHAFDSGAAAADPLLSTGSEPEVRASKEARLGGATTPITRPEESVTESFSNANNGTLSDRLVWAKGEDGNYSFHHPEDIKDGIAVPHPDELKPGGNYFGKPLVDALKAVNDSLGERGSIKVAPESFGIALKSIGEKAKNFTDFSKELSAKFGTVLKEHALKLWNWVKQKLSEDRGSISTKDKKQPTSSPAKEEIAPQKASSQASEPKAKPADHAKVYKEQMAELKAKRDTLEKAKPDQADRNAYSKWKEELQAINKDILQRHDWAKHLAEKPAQDSKTDLGKGLDGVLEKLKAKEPVAETRAHKQWEEQVTALKKIIAERDRKADTAEKRFLQENSDHIIKPDRSDDEQVETHAEQKKNMDWEDRASRDESEESDFEHNRKLGAPDMRDVAAKTEDSLEANEEPRKNYSGKQDARSPWQKQIDAVEKKFSSVRSIAKTVSKIRESDQYKTPEVRHKAIEDEKARISKDNEKVIADLSSQMERNPKLTEEAVNEKTGEMLSTSIHDLIIEEMHKLGSEYSLRDLKNYILKAEGISSFRQLETFPESLFDFSEHSEGLKTRELHHEEPAEHVENTPLNNFLTNLRDEVLGTKKKGYDPDAKSKLTAMLKMNDRAIRRIMAAPDRMVQILSDARELYSNYQWPEGTTAKQKIEKQISSIRKSILEEYGKTEDSTLAGRLKKEGLLGPGTKKVTDTMRDGKLVNGQFIENKGAKMTVTDDFIKFLVKHGGELAMEPLHERDLLPKDISEMKAQGFTDEQIERLKESGTFTAPTIEDVGQAITKFIGPKRGSIDLALESLNPFEVHDPKATGVDVNGYIKSLDATSRKVLADAWDRKYLEPIRESRMEAKAKRDAMSYEAYKKMAALDTRAAGLIEDVFNALHGISRDARYNESVTFDAEKILNLIEKQRSEKTFSSKEEALSSKGKLKDERRENLEAVKQVLKYALEIPDGEFEHFKNREEVFNRPDVDRVDKNGNPLLDKEGKPLKLKGLTEYNAAETSEELATKDQLGARTEVDPIDASDSRNRNRNLFNLRDAVLFEVLHPDYKDPKKIVSEFMTRSQYESTIKTFEKKGTADKVTWVGTEKTSTKTDNGIVKELNQHATVLKWDEINDLKAFARRALDAGFMSDKEIEATVKLVNRLNAADKAKDGKLKSQLTKDLVSDTLKYRFRLSEDNFKKSRMLDKDFFEEQAKRFKELGLSAGEMHKVYLEAGSDKGIFFTRINRMLQEHFGEKYDKAYRELEGAAKAEPAKVKELVTAELSSEDRAAYEKFTASGERKVGEKLPMVKRIRFEALKDLEARLLAYGERKAAVVTTKEAAGPSKKAMTQEELRKQELKGMTEVDVPLLGVKNKDAEFVGPPSIAGVIASNGLHPSMAMRYSQKALGKMTDFEHSLNVASVGKLRGKIEQKFYELISKAFGADLVIVSDPDYRSRYLGSSIDGRPKLVINIDKGTSFARVYAHEMFHHVVNKALPHEYEKFKEAVLATVDEKKWNDTIDYLQRRMFPDTNITETAEHLISKFNRADRSSVKSGLGYLDDAAGLKQPHERAKVAGLESSNYDSFETARRSLDQQGHSSETYTRGAKVDRENLAARSAAEEELLAELFTHSVTNKAFWQHMADSGNTNLAGRIMARLIERVASIYDTLGDRKLGFVYEKNLLVKHSDMDNIYDLISSLVSDSSKSETLNHATEKFHTTDSSWISDKEKEKLKGMAVGAKDGLTSFWRTIFPKASKSFRSVMDALEKHGEKIPGLVKALKPKGIFADFLADPEQVKQASKLMHGMEFEVAKVQRAVVEKHKDAFKGMTTEDLEKLHDAFVRQGQDIEASSLTEEQKSAFRAYKEVADGIYEKLKVLYPDLKKIESHFGQSLKWFRKDGMVLDDAFDWMTKPEFSKLEGSKQFTKEMAQDMTTREIAETFNLEYKTINPHDLLLDYVRDTTKLFKLHEMIKDGTEAGTIKFFEDQYKAAKAGYFPINDNSTKIFAAMNPTAGFKVKVGEDYYQKGGQDAVFATRDEAVHAVAHYAKGGTIEEVAPEATVHTSHFSVFRVEHGANGRETKTEIRSFKKVEAANDYAESLQNDKDVTHEVVPQQTKVDNALVSRMYFKEDLARMINVILSPDKIRQGKLLGISGETVMNVKNQMTSIEFAFSMFHAMTIGQEMVASNAAWNIQRHKGQGMLGKLSGFNARKAVREVKVLSSVFDAVLGNEDLAQNPEVQRKVNEILGTTNADVLDVIKQFYDAGGLLGQDKTLRSDVHSLGEMKYGNGGQLTVNEDGSVNFGKFKFDHKAVVESIGNVWDSQLKEHGNGKLVATFNTARFAGMEATTNWLMEQGIPKVKMVQFAKEYTLALDRNREKLEAGLTSKEEIARDTMKFIEDRFGEVNWKNMWMDNSVKTALQFAFRSFTWFTGSFKALGKAGIDLGKLGWFTLKGEDYELTTKGWWGINALVTHVLTASLISLAYNAFSAVTPGEEVEDDPETPTLTKWLFPRVDKFDPTKRMTVPSYVSEAYKIMLHLGMLGSSAEPSKLISGRFNSFIGKGIELWNNEDFRGVSIRNSDDNLVKQAADVMWHVAPLPISFSTIGKDWRDKGMNAGSLATGILGMTDAPAAAKRSDATNLAFELRRKEYKGKEISAEEMEEKDALKRAMYAYQQGDPSQITAMLTKGEISKRQYDIALSKIPLIGDKPNPKYVDQLSQAFKGLTFEGKLKVWEKMSEEEQKKHKAELMKTYFNMMSRQDKSPIEKEGAKASLRELGLL